MSLLSFTFPAFLAGTVLLYYLTPLCLRKWVPLGASAVFWALSGPLCFGAVVLESLWVWAWGGRIRAAREAGRTGRGALAAALIPLFAALLLLREGPRAAALTGGALGAFLPAAPPLGLSYMTFMGAGSLIDVFRGKAAPKKNPLKVLAYLGFFPHLVQGPIDFERDLAPQLDTPHSLQEGPLVRGVFLMTWGYFKKLVLADRLAPLTAALALRGGEMPGWAVLLTGALYTVQLYADFSGGIDIVRGSAGLMGIRLGENFRRPLLARSVGEFWRRWHISLGAWFRSYVLYPLTLSRAGLALGRVAKKRLGPRVGSALPGALAAFAVFVLIGLWHTLRWNALLYGCWFGAVSFFSLLLEPFFRQARKKHPRLVRSPGWRLFCRVRTLLWVFFAQFFVLGTSPGQAFALFGRVFLSFGSGTLPDIALLLPDIRLPLEAGIAAAAGAVLLGVDLLGEKAGDLSARAAAAPLFLRWPLLMLLALSVLVFGVYGAGVDPAAFVYAGF